MAVGYPPIPIYPAGIDSDYTLFLVYNSAEAELAADNEPWAEEIIVVPRTSLQLEIWSDNGFANINGELLYYDAVDKDSNNKVYRLKRCARSLGGTPTQFNKAGAMVRGFVVAEQHNQLVDAIILTEKFIGFDFTEDTSTLDWRIRNLQAVPLIFDDFGCPDVVFHFTVVSSDPSSGTVVNYRLEVTGSFNEFTLNFGDGSSTSSIQQGTHTYAPNANINPVVTFKNQNCQVVQTPVERDSVESPEPTTFDISYSAPNSPTFTFPDINIAAPVFPEPDLTLPPFQFPCFPNISDLGLSPVSLPSVILFEPAINIPSLIEFEQINIPSFIGIGAINLPSIIQIEIPDIHLIVPNIPNPSLIVPQITIPPITIGTPSITIPNISVIIPTIPNININVPTFPNIEIDVPDFPDINITWGDPPDINIVWGDPPDINVIFPTPPTISVIFPPPPDITIVWGAPPDVDIDWGPPPSVPHDWGTPPHVTVDWSEPPTVHVEWTSPPTVPFDWGQPPTVNVSWGNPPSIPVDYGETPTLDVNWGVPPVIQVNVALSCPSTPLALAADPLGLTEDMLGVGRDLEVSYDLSGFPSEVKLVADSIKLEHTLPSEIILKSIFPDIKFDTSVLPSMKIELPDTPLIFETIGIPDSIKLEADFLIPERIELYTSVNIPERIFVESDIPRSIKIEGMPEFIRLEHDLPKSIKLEMPEKPEIELVYKGSGIPVQVELAIQKTVGEQEKLNCFALVPCNQN